ASEMKLEIDNIINRTYGLTDNQNEKLEASRISSEVDSRKKFSFQVVWDLKRFGPFNSRMKLNLRRCMRLFSLSFLITVAVFASLNLTSEVRAFLSPILAGDQTKVAQDTGEPSDSVNYQTVYEVLSSSPAIGTLHGL